MTIEDQKRVIRLMRLLEAKGKLEECEKQLNLIRHSLEAAAFLMKDGDAFTDAHFEEFRKYEQDLYSVSKYTTRVLDMCKSKKRETGSIVLDQLRGI